MITIYKNIWSKEPHYIEAEKALERIRNGNSANQVARVRECLDKERAQELKMHLPSVCFSGTFKKDRQDIDLIKHSGFLILDFDKISDIEGKKAALISESFVYATWISPGGKGVKALIKIANGDKHREHFQALQDVYPQVDKSGINESRVCYESYDPGMLVNQNPKPFTKLKKIERVVESVKKENNIEIFNNILKWLSNKGNAFVTGERNLFIFKLAGACCRFGIDKEDCISLCNMSILSNDNQFTNKEAETTIKSAYKQNSDKYGSATFENERLVDRVSKSEVEIIDSAIYDMEVRPRDVFFGEDVKSEALEIYDNGYKSAHTTYIPEIDYHWKWKKGEITLLSGIGNYGKSTLEKYLLVIQAIKDKAKIAIFSPEEFPASEFYHDLVEIYFAQDCTPSNENRPNKEQYEKVYDMFSKHFFFVYPKDIAPTPVYIKERFLELIVKEKCEYCIIDPFNQLANDYNSTGGRTDKYLETTLSDFSRFVQRNNVYFTIIAHPKQLQKDKTGNYPCPDVFDINDGAMWNNKMDNIIIYHLPERQTDPKSTICEFHSKKIRRRKIVGQLGHTTFEFSAKMRRFFFNGKDHLAAIIFAQADYKQGEIPLNTDFLTQKPETIQSISAPKEFVIHKDFSEHPF